MEKKRCVIIGGGPAGYTAAIYASRAGLEPVLYEGAQPGGQLTTATLIENFPGFRDGIDAFELMTRMREQAGRVGADIKSGVVEKVDFSQRVKKLTVDGEEVLCDAVIVATGASARFLGLESEARYRGRGVSACATCDGFFFRGKSVAVVGGGDSACEEALYLATLCARVFLVVRRDVLRASKALQDRIVANGKIEIRYGCRPAEILGDGESVTGMRLDRSDGSAETLEVQGVFVAIGVNPNSELFADWLERDAAGYIVTHDGQKTSVPGVFAAGDVQDPRYRQAITAAASGCRAAVDLENYLNNEIL